MTNNLEVCLSILKFFDKKGPQTPDKIEISTITNAELIGKSLNLLIEQRLIEKKANHNKQEICTITNRGKKVLEFFRVKY